MRLRMRESLHRPCLRISRSSFVYPGAATRTLQRLQDTAEKIFQSKPEKQRIKENFGRRKNLQERLSERQKEKDEQNPKGI